tara:strand:- start:265 stop:771 length:507 start_codon:yes stop_codon:yes gene_type:complete
MTNEFSYMDGDVVDLAVLMGSANLGRDNIDYVGADGEAADEEDEYFNASGPPPRRRSSSSKRRPKRRGRFGGFINNTLNRFGFSEKAMADKRQIEMEQAKANQALAANAGSGPDISALLATPAVVTPPKAPMSKGLKIGLIVGGVVVAGAITYFIIKSAKSKKAKAKK